MRLRLISKFDPDLFTLLDELDQMVINYGGRIYLSKDVRMSESTFKRSYSRWENFVKIRKQAGADKLFHSLQINTIRTIKMKKILIIGATSAIAEATARLFAQRGDRLYLLARNIERLTTMAADLKIRGAFQIDYAGFDANQFASHEACLKKALETLGEIDIVLIAHGNLSNQKISEQNFEYAQQELNINAISTISLLTYLANRLEAQKSGTIAVITSVAGDRGRQSNYIYGTAKAMVTHFLQGLRNRLYKSHVHVLDIKPGFVDTPMTAHFKKGLLWASPDTIAKAIVRGINKRQNTVYTPFFWRFIMLIVCGIPENIFKKLTL